MKLFDYCWFKLQIFTKQQNLSKLPSFEANPENEIQEKKYQNLRFHAPLPSILGSWVTIVALYRAPYLPTRSSSLQSLIPSFHACDCGCVVADIAVAER